MSKDITASVEAGEIKDDRCHVRTGRGVTLIFMDTPKGVRKVATEAEPGCSSFVPGYVFNEARRQAACAFQSSTNQDERGLILHTDLQILQIYIGEKKRNRTKKTVLASWLVENGIWTIGRERHMLQLLDPESPKVKEVAQKSQPLLI